MGGWNARRARRARNGRAGLGAGRGQDGSVDAVATHESRRVRSAVGDEVQLINTYEPIPETESNGITESSCQVCALINLQYASQVAAAIFLSVYVYMMYLMNLLGFA
jgi:hypothetical protein